MLQFSTVLIVAAFMLSACARPAGEQSTNLRRKTVAFPARDKSAEDIAPISSGLKEHVPQEEMPAERAETLPDTDAAPKDPILNDDVEDSEVVVARVPDATSASEIPPTPETAEANEVSEPKVEDVAEEEEAPADEADIEEAPADTKLDDAKSLLAEFTRFNPRFRLTLAGSDNEDQFAGEETEVALNPEKDALRFPTAKNILHFKKNEAEKLRDDYALVVLLRTAKKAGTQSVARLSLSAKESESADKKEKEDKKAPKVAKQKDKKTKERSLSVELTLKNDRPSVRIVEKVNKKNKKPIILRPKFKLSQKDWSLLAITFVGKDMHIYCGTKLLGKTKVDAHYDYEKTELVIGGSNKNGKDRWEGEIAELHLYDGVPAIFRGG